ncbi:MAG: glycerol-3-phosphate 1-O-acyltransferase PlsY [Bacteroidales bacterium]|nr:glycerol-3-phosphate 1-O-acyltransferase PlsY [Bacteroidales bacterium]HOY38952.1 glycerol-3-phosphate 1-O-acyltransferase PlsY [Bacteroidales bacterium]HQP03613.1 glycerol-3-phosphate 1-O-acyltransferase PlsY [Bacteroidales bacterium]
MQLTLFIVLPVIAYLIGSFSSAVWYGKWFRGIDLRNEGSKNAGATNAFRVLGASVAIPVFITDAAKGFASVYLVYFLNFDALNEWFWVWGTILGICSVLGHIFPLYTGFRGGKGVACMLGVLLALQPFIALCCFGVFALVFLLFKIVSVGSLVAAISYPVFNFFIFETDSLTLRVFSLLTATLVIIMHHKNIRRLVSGTEKKLSFRPHPGKKA